MREIGLTKTDKFMRISDVQSISGLSRSQIYVLVSRGEFPKQVKVSEKASAWLASEVEAWMNERVASRILKSGDWNESPPKG